MLMEIDTPPSAAIEVPAEERPFLVVVAGEFKSGKSSLINALLRQRLLPTTSEYYQRPAILVRQSDTETGGLVYDRDGLRGQIDALHPGVDLSSVTLCEMFTRTEHLADVDLVELPFYSDGVVTDDTIAMMAAADLLVWVTIGSQSWRLSEKSTLLRLPHEMRDRTVLAVSRTDKFRNASDRQRIADRLTRETKGIVREILFVASSPDLIQTSTGDDAAWVRTGGAALCDLIRAGRERQLAERRAHAAANRSDNVIAFPGAGAEAGPGGPADAPAAATTTGPTATAIEPFGDTGTDARTRATRAQPPAVAAAPAPAPGPAPGFAPGPAAIAQPQRLLTDLQRDRLQALRDIAATINGLQAAGIARVAEDRSLPLVLDDTQGLGPLVSDQARACLAAIAAFQRAADASGPVEDAIIVCGRVTLLVAPCRARGDLLYLLVRHDKTNAAIARTILRRMDLVWST